MVNLRNRLILSHAFLVLLVTLLTGIALVYVLETQVIMVNLSIQLSRQADLMAEIARDYPAIWSDSSQAQAFIDRFRGRTSAQLMLLDANGEILASSDSTDRPLLGHPLPDSSITTILDGEESIQLDYSQNLQAEIVDVFVPAFGPDGQVVGVVRLTHQLATVRERFERTRNLILEVLTAGLLLGMTVGLILAITVERPIKRLTLAINQLGSDEQLDLLPEQGPPEIRLLVNTFNSLVERLHVLRTARRQLLANLAHELRRPLAALRSASYALLDGAADDVPLRNELLQGIDIELRTLQRLVDDLSRFYDQALGTLELSLKPTVLNDWIPAVLGPWREAAQRKGLKWQVSIPTDMPVLLIDSDRLGQALGNLLSNAIKYTPSGGAISVVAGCADETVWIQVSDTGMGIDSEEERLIFEPFYRGRVKTRYPQGMGLGLTIARDLIIAHGGRLEANTNLDRGCRFTLWLPLTS